MAWNDVDVSLAARKIDIISLISGGRRVLWKTLVVATVLGAVVAFVLPVQYTAETTLLPPQQNSSLGSLLSTQVGAVAGLGALTGGNLGLKDPNDIYLGMLQSKTTADHIIQKFQLQSVYRDRKLSQAEKDLARRTQALSTKDGLIKISVEDRDPDRAAQLANAYVSELKGLRVDLAVSEASQRRIFFDAQLQQAQQNLIVAEERLKGTQQQTGVLQLDAQTRVVIEDVSRLKGQIAAKQVQLEVLSTYATAENPQRVLLGREIGGLQSQLDMLQRKEGNGSNLQVPTAQLPTVGMTYVNQLRDVRYYETITELLAKQLEIAKLDEARQGSALQVLDTATPPDTKSFPSRSLIILGFAVLGFLGALTFIVLRELLGHAAPARVEADRA